MRAAHALAVNVSWRPSDVVLANWLRPSFGAPELEHAAVALVRAMQVAGDTWSYVGLAEIRAGITASMKGPSEEDREVWRLFQLQPRLDFAGLEARDFTAIDLRDGPPGRYAFTRLGTLALRHHARAPPPRARPEALAAERARRFE